MPLIAWLGSAFATVLSSFKAWFLLLIQVALANIIIKVLLAFGIGYITYELGSFALSTLFNDFKSSLSGLPGDLLTFVSIAKIDKAITILFGGLAARLTLAGFSSVMSATGKKRSMTLGGNE